MCECFSQRIFKLMILGWWLSLQLLVLPHTPLQHLSPEYKGRLFIHRRTTGGGKGGSSPPWASQGGEVPPPEDLVQSRHREISATFEIRKKSYWPYLRVLHPVDAIYIHSPSISINKGVQLGGGKGGSSPGWASQGGRKFPPWRFGPKSAQRNFRNIWN